MFYIFTLTVKYKIEQLLIKNISLFAELCVCGPAPTTLSPSQDPQALSLSVLPLPSPLCCLNTLVTFTSGGDTRPLGHCDWA